MAPFGQTPTGTAYGLVFTALLIGAAVGDFRSRRIPNRLVAAIALIGLVGSVATDPLFPGLYRSAGGLAVGLGLWLPFYVLRWLGAGDVKLFAAAGAWLGPLSAIEGALIAACAGALLAIVWMVGGRGAKGTAETLGIAAGTPAILTPQVSSSRSSLPYGIAIAFGAIWAGWMPRMLIG